MDELGTHFLLECFCGDLLNITACLPAKASLCALSLGLSFNSSYLNII